MSKQGCITFPLIALNTIGSARGLIAGDFFDKDGNLSGGREGNIYTQGLENQARISANQTAGVGKLGEFTREQMNAIQYGAEAGVLNQMAQGNSLRRVFGTGAGFQESYSAMANTQADMQNIQAKETARSAREHFKGIGTSSAEGSAYSRVSRLQADQRFEEIQGSTDAYETARGVNPNIAREQTQLGAASKFKSTEASLNNINAGNHQDAIDKLSSATANEAGEKAFQSNAGFQEKVKQGVANSDGSMTNGEYKTGLEAQTRFDTGQAVTNMKNAPANIQKSIDEQHNKAQAERDENYKKGADKPLANQSFIDRNMYLTGALIRSGGYKDFATLNFAGAEQKVFDQIDKDEAENQRLKAALSQSNEALNAAKSGDFGSAGALTGVQNYTLGTAGTTGTFNASGGFVQGGTQSGVSLSHNTQHSYSSGITASGGSLFAASATQMGFSADGFAAGASALSAVGQIASTASMFSRTAGGISSLMGGAGGDALMAAQQGVQRASARVASAQSQLNWATEQAAGTHQRFGGAYAGMNAQQVGAESARLQMGIHDMNMRVGRLNGIKGKLISDGANKYDPTIKALDRQMRHLNTNINRDGMRVKYLGLRNNQINAEHNLAQAQLEESFARIKLSSL